MSFWLMLEKRSNPGEGSVQKDSITKWKWFIQEHARGRCKEVVSSLPGATLEPPAMLLDPMATWATWKLPYQQLSIDQQRVLVYGWQFQDEQTASCLEDHHSD